jgi:hypothetical protein
LRSLLSTNALVTANSKSICTALSNGVQNFKDMDTVLSLTPSEYSGIVTADPAIRIALKAMKEEGVGERYAINAVESLKHEKKTSERF